MAPPPTTLLGLPGELQNNVFELLDYCSAITLSSTCTYLRGFPQPLPFFKDAAKHAILRDHESVPQHAGDKGFACYKCWKIKPSDDFVDK